MKAALELDGKIHRFPLLLIWIVAKMSESLIVAEVTTCAARSASEVHFARSWVQVI